MDIALSNRLGAEVIGLVILDGTAALVAAGNGPPFPEPGLSALLLL